jgi:gluconolactonase
MEESTAAAGDRGLRLVAEGLGFTEGPVVLADGSFVVTSLTHGAVYRVRREGGHEPLAEVGGGANGAAVDADGVLYIAQSGGRWVRNGPSWPPDHVGGVQRIGVDGSVSWVSRDPVSPNDICFGPDGQLYVTDPTRSPRIRDGRLWRIDPASGAAELLFSTPWFCNGLAFGYDDLLYLASTYESRIYAVDPFTETVERPEPVFELTEGQPDGLAIDSRGRIVVGAIDATRAAPGSVQTYTDAGALVDVFRPGTDSHYTNIAFDGRGGLVITSSDRGAVLLAERWDDPGLALHPFRGHEPGDRR